MYQDDVGALGLLQKRSCSRVILWRGYDWPEKRDRHSGNVVADIFSVLVTSSLLQNKLVNELILL